MNGEFDDIRPYHDSEIPAAMERIVKNISFPLLANYVYPHRSMESVRELMLGCKSTEEFQRSVMYSANEQIISNSISQFSCNGTEYLDPEKSYLFVSNHRDIMLDSSLLQNVFVDHGLNTTEITFGANLMMSQLVIDIGKCNKMFKVFRPGHQLREFYTNSLHLSEYIRHTLTVKGESVWTAQRNGRTKDGNDKTDQGLVKMLCMSSSECKIQAVDELRVVPVSVSYEWESCDILKSLELYQSQYTTYVKKPGEDLNSILTGIEQFKGRVHMEICRPLERQELEAYSDLTSQDYHRAVASLIDKRIWSSYRLYPNNYIAYDLRYGTQRFAPYYTAEEKNLFLKQMRRLENYDECNMEQLTDIYLQIYSNPVKNKI